jgi:hypothetical protein
MAETQSIDRYDVLLSQIEQEAKARQTVIRKNKLKLVKP